MTKVLCFLALASFVSCQCSYRFDVYVRNSCSSPIELEFQSDAVENYPLPQKVKLAPGDYTRIIRTKNIPADNQCKGTMAKHCIYVANYVQAKTPEGVSSTMAWCDEEITFSKTDIQQGEFLIEYRDDHFIR